jgi:hydrogenase nickel incorporation protein HypA/HybF
MHEMSIAMNLVDIMSNVLHEHADPRLVSVTVKVGCMTGIVPESLEMAFSIVAEQTFGHVPELIIEQIPISGCCRDCGHTFVFTRFPVTCENCESINVEPSGGRELELTALEVEEPNENHQR